MQSVVKLQKYYTRDEDYCKRFKLMKKKDTRFKNF